MRGNEQGSGRGRGGIQEDEEGVEGVGRRRGGGVGGEVSSGLPGSLLEMPEQKGTLLFCVAGP